MGAARQVFRPEFLNRIDDFVVFQPLDQQQIMRIVDLQVRAYTTAICRAILHCIVSVCPSLH